MKKCLVCFTIFAFSFLLLVPAGSQNSFAQSEPSVADIKWFAGNFAPRNYAECNGQLLTISQNTALFSLLGNTYGGDGRTTFGLPEMRGRMPMDDGAGPGLTPRNLGVKAGAENIDLSLNQLPSHTHSLRAVDDEGSSVTPDGGALHHGRHHFLHRIYSTETATVPMDSSAIATTGGGQTHNNIPPFLTINCIIALTGIFSGGPSTIGELKFVPTNNFPVNIWAPCDGQILPIAQNTALFSLLGNTYGGDGRTTFGLPDMRGRIPMDDGAGPGLTPRNFGARGGTEDVTLSVAQMPSHSHILRGTSDSSDSTNPNNNLLGTGDHPFANKIYKNQISDTPMGSSAIANAGGNQAHDNMPPFLSLNCLIGLTGAFPTRTGSGVGDEPFLAEIRFFPYNFVPGGFEPCDGQLLPINQNQALFSLLGTTYGGDGRTTFGLPDMQGRMPMHDGAGPGLTSRPLGARGGVESVTLSVDQMPSHSNNLQASSTFGNSLDPAGNVLATGNHPKYQEMYSTSNQNLVPMHASSIDSTGGDQAHDNMPPFLAVKCGIAVQGIFPSRN